MAPGTKLEIFKKKSESHYLPSLPLYIEIKLEILDPPESNSKISNLAPGQQFKVIVGY